MKPTLVAFIGKPLAGKDSQSDRFVLTHPDAVKISTGAILREVKDTGESHRFWPILGPYLPYMDQGLKLPDEPILETLGKVTEEYLNDGKKWVVFAGSPRSEQQLTWFDATAMALGTPIKYIYLDTSDAETYKRTQTRNEGRKEDTPEMHAIRLVDYTQNTEPMIAKLNKEGRLISLDGEQPVETVARHVDEALHVNMRDPEINLPMMARR